MLKNGKTKDCVILVLTLLTCHLKLFKANVEVTNTSQTNGTAENTRTHTSEAGSSTDSAAAEKGRMLDVHDDSLCTCDLTYDFCDVNCCCDSDCTTDDKNLFAACINVGFGGDVNMCERTYLDAHLRKKTELSDSYLCIWKDNFDERHLLPDIKEVSTLEDFDQLISKRSYSAKYVGLDDMIDPVHHTQYVFVNSSNKRVLGVPYPIVGHICNSYLPVQFIENAEFECFQVLKSLSNECETNPALNAVNYYQEITIVGAKEPKILVEFCKEDTKICINKEDLPEPQYNATENACRNVVSSLEYVVRHAGPNSITRVVARISLHNVAAAPSKQLTWFKQKFLATFEWDNDKARIPLSGNPGYLVGYPVLAASVKTRRKFGNNQWLTVHAPAQNGECVVSSAIPVLFGENIVAGCSITVSGAAAQDVCSKLSQILEMVLCNIPSHVGAYGNSSRSQTGDWVPFLYEDSSSVASCQTKSIASEDDKCAGIVRELYIELAYVYIGFSDNRQAKIIGALIKAKPESVQLEHSQSSGWTLSTYVATSVSFVDITEPPASTFSPFPTFDVRLPHDFFYPFVH